MTYPFVLRWFLYFSSTTIFFPKLCPRRPYWLAVQLIYCFVSNATIHISSFIILIIKYINIINIQKYILNDYGGQGCLDRYSTITNYHYNMILLRLCSAFPDKTRWKLPSISRAPMTPDQQKNS